MGAFFERISSAIKRIWFTKKIKKKKRKQTRKYKKSSQKIYLNVIAGLKSIALANFAKHLFMKFIEKKSPKKED